MALVLGGSLLACDVPTDLPRFESTFVVPTERLLVPVASQPVSATLTHDLAEAKSLASRTRGGALVVDVENASAASGRIDLRVSNGDVDVMASIDAGGESRQRVPLTRGEVQSLLGSMVTLRASGTLCPSSGCSVNVANGGVVTLQGRFELVLEVGAER